jgi:hypothetical protein
LGSAHIKAVCETLVKLTLEVREKERGREGVEHKKGVENISGLKENK